MRPLSKPWTRCAKMLPTCRLLTFSRSASLSRMIHQWSYWSIWFHRPANFTTIKCACEIWQKTVKSQILWITLNNGTLYTSCHPTWKKIKFKNLSKRFSTEWKEQRKDPQSPSSRKRTWITYKSLQANSLPLRLEERCLPLATKKIVKSQLSSFRMTSKTTTMRRKDPILTQMSCLIWLTTKISVEFLHLPISQASSPTSPTLKSQQPVQISHDPLNKSKLL